MFTGLGRFGSSREALSAAGPRVPAISSAVRTYGSIEYTAATSSSAWRFGIWTPVACEEAGRRAQETAHELAEARRELDGIRRAQAADADKLRELVEAQRIPEAATYLAARTLGLNLEESAQVLLSLVQSIVAEDVPVTTEVSTSGAIAAPIPVIAEPPPPASAPSISSACPPPPRRSPVREWPLTSQAPVFAAVGVDRDQKQPEPHLSPGKVGRNSPCPCGSGKKFKWCCGPLVG